MGELCRIAPGVEHKDLVARAIKESEEI